MPSQSLRDQLNALAPHISRKGEEIERTRRLPDDLVTSLKSLGAFRALIPRRFGGGELPFDEFVRGMQTLAAADASTAWCVNQAAVIGLTSLWLPEETILEIWADERASVANGPPLDSVITPAGAGFCLKGHWGFSSGCQHATWMMGAARHAEDGFRIAYFRPDDVEFIDRWQVAGLRGTGSFEFTVTDLQLESRWVGDMSQPATVEFDLTIIPNALLFATSFAAVALGVAEAALDDVVEIANAKTPRFIKTRVADDPDVQRLLGKAMASYRAADAYLHGTLASVLDVVRERRSIEAAQRAELRMAGTHVIQECARVVDMAYKIAGSTGIYHGETLQRRYQDMHVITQHVQAREAYFAALGRYRLSGDYELGPMM